MNRKIRTALAISVLLLSNLAISQESNQACNPSRIGEQDSTCFGTYISGIQQQAAPSVTKNVAPPPIKPFAGGLSCTTPWGAVIPNGGGVNAFFESTATYDASTNEWAVGCREQYRVCVSGTLSGSYQYPTCDLQPVNGSCGSSNGQYFTSPSPGPTGGSLCSPEFVYGTPPTDDSPPSMPASSAVTPNNVNNTYNWTCRGEAGGSTASCMAFNRINGQCGSYVNDCAKGNLSSSSQNDIFDVTSKYVTTSYIWQCNGTNTGSNASCSTDVYDPLKATPIPPPPPTYSCSSIPGPLSGGPEVFLLPQYGGAYCQGRFGRPSGNEGDTFLAKICSTGQSGCYCGTYITQCKNGAWNPN